jgi:DNA repair protein RadA/Sms
MSDKLSTGLAVVDRHMHGGIPVGSLLVLAAPPESQSDLFLSAVTTVADTYYLTAGRTADAVRSRRQRPGAGDTALAVETVSPETFTADPEGTLAAVPTRGFLVVDSFDEFERLAPDAQLRALRALSSCLRERESVGLLHCAKQETRTPARRRTLQFADVVWMLHLIVTSLSVDTRLTITKVRDGLAHLEPVKLKLTDTVVVDTSRDIA